MSTITVRAIYKTNDDDDKPVTYYSQPYEIKDFDPVNGDSQFNWYRTRVPRNTKKSSESYLGFDDLAWSELEWEIV